jgi:autotransporter-associated beta strand protein
MIAQRAAATRSWRGAYLASASVFAMLVCGTAGAGQLPASAFSAYSGTGYSTISAGTLLSVHVDSIMPTQMDEGLSEVGKKTAAWDLLGTIPANGIINAQTTTPAAVENVLLTGGDIEPVVIGPGGQLYLTDGHHTFTALQNSIWGATNPVVYVVVIANYSGLSESAFWTQMEASNFVLPLADGVVQTLNVGSGSPLPTTLALNNGNNSGMQSDPYRGLEYSVLKNKNSVLFPTTANLAGVAGSSLPGLDKTAAYYSDFIWANAYRSANNGLGLAYLSPGDIQLATQWSLTGTNTISNVGNATTVAQLPGYILPAGITISGVISDATIANNGTQSGVLDGSKTGTFDQSTTFASFNGLRAMAVGSSVIGSNAPGFVLQLGSDLGNAVTLSGLNTYNNGTTILAGTLIITSDQNLGNASPGGWSFNSTSPVTATYLESGNALIFNSLTEGNGTLQINSAGTSSSPATVTIARPIAVDSEQANINAAQYTTVVLTGPIVSLGVGGTPLGNANGYSDLSFNCVPSGFTSSITNFGTVELGTSTSYSNPYFYGNVIVSNGTLEVWSDAGMGATSATTAATSASAGVPYMLGAIDLDGGTFQTMAAISNSQRNIFLTGGSTFNTNGFASTFNTLTDVQRTLTVTNSSSSTAGSVAFTGTTIGGTATIQVNGGTAGASINLGAVTRGDVAGNSGVGYTDTATLLLLPTSGASLGGTDKIFASGSAATTIGTTGIVAPWIVINNSATNNNYDFATYNAQTGFGTATYTSTNLTTATATSVVKQSAAASITANTAAFALNLQKGYTVTISSGQTLTLGDGTNPAGLIMSGSSATITGGTLAFGGSEAVISVVGSNTISSAITGTNGLTLAGSGTLTLSGTEQLTGAISVDSGTLVLGTANMFAGDAQVTLSDVKSKPAAAGLTVNASNTLASLNSAGNNSTVTLGSGVVLTIGDTTNNDSSTLSSTITENGSAVAGALTFNGTGLADLSGIKKGKLTLAVGSTINVEDGTLRLSGASLTNNNNITLTGGNLQFASNGGGIYGGNISGTGSVRLIGGTLVLTGTGNSYSGGTFVETGSTLDLTTANVATVANVNNLTNNGNIGVAGGQVVFDQATSGTYNGVISDAAAMGIGATMSGSLVKDDSTGANGGNVTLGQVQAYSGTTTIEAGTLTLGIANALADSQLVDLGRIGGGSNATLAITADQILQSLTGEAGNTTQVNLNGHTLTLGSSTNANSNYAGTISGGAVAKSGTGTATLSGNNTFTGVSGANNGSAISVNAGTLVMSGNNTFTGVAAVGSVPASADVTVNGGTLVVTGNNTYTNGKVTVGSNGTFQATVAGLNGTASGSTLAITDNGAVVLDSGSTNVSWAGTISGTGTVTKIGTSTLTLTGINTYTGVTTVAAGQLVIGAGGSLVSQVVVTGGTFDNNSSSNTTLTSLTGGIVNLSGSGSNTVSTVSGTGVLDISGGNTTITTLGGTTTSGGAVNVTGGSATITNLGTGGAATVSGGTAAITNLGAGGNATVTSGIANIGTVSGNATLNITGGTTTITTLGGSGTTTLAAAATATTTNLTATGTVTLGLGATLTAGGNDASVNTFSGTMTGGTLIKADSDTLILNTTATTTSVLDVTGGKAELATGAVYDGPVTIASGGSFGGGGTVNSTINVQTGGILAPGDSPATTTVAGTVTQGNSSTLSLDIDGTGTGTGAGNYSRLVITGIASQYVIGLTDILQPNLRNIVGPANNTYSPTLGTDLTVVTAQGGVTGTFATLNQPGVAGGQLAGTRFDAIYTTNAINLVTTPTAYGNLAAAGISASQNQNNVGSAIDKLRATAATGYALDLRGSPSDAATVLSTLYLLPGAAIPGALDQIGGASHANTVAADLSRAAAVSQVLDQRLNGLRDGTLAGSTAMAGLGGPQLAFAGSKADMAAMLADAGDTPAAKDGSTGHVWGRGLGAFSQTGSDNNGSAFHAATGGALAGFDAEVVENLNLGLAGGLTKTVISGGDNIDSYSGHLYGTYALGAAFVDGTAGYAHNDYSSSRSISFAGLSRQANGSAGGNDLSAGIKGGYRLKIDNTLIEPVAGLSWLRAQRDAFSETGANSLDLSVGDTHHTSVQSSLGGRVVRSYMADETLKIEPEVSAAWKHDFRDRAVTDNTSLDGQGYAVSSTKTGRDGAVLGLGVAASDNGNTKLFLDYTAEAREHETDQTITAGIRVKW